MPMSYPQWHAPIPRASTVGDAAELKLDSGVPRDPAWEDLALRSTWRWFDWIDVLLVALLLVSVFSAPALEATANADDARIQRVGVAVMATYTGRTSGRNPQAIIAYSYGGQSYSHTISHSPDYAIGRTLTILIDPADPRFIGYPDGTADDAVSLRGLRWLVFGLIAFFVGLMAARIRYLYTLLTLLQSTPAQLRFYARTAAVKSGRSLMPVMAFYEEPTRPATFLVARRAFGSRTRIKTLRSISSGTPVSIIPGSGKTLAVALPGQRPSLALLPRNATTGLTWLDAPAYGGSSGRP